MYGKQATIELIKSLLDYNGVEPWGRALRYAVKQIEETIQSDEDFIDDLTDNIYNCNNQRDLPTNDIRNEIKSQLNAPLGK